MTLNISLYQNGEDLSADVLNRPQAQIRDAVSSLQTSVAAITAHETLYRTSVLCGDAYAVGTVVYLDTDGVAKKALAAWDSAFGDRGETLVARSARPLGVITAIEGTVATVLTQGTLASEAANLELFDIAAPTASTWYLSETTPGAVTTTRPSLPVHIIDVDAAGAVNVLPATSPLGYHIHKSYPVEIDPLEWTEGTGTYLYTYTGSALTDLAPFNVTDAVIVQTISSNTRINDDFILTRDEAGAVVLKSKVDPPTASSITIYITLPFVTEQPVVRAISTPSPRLRASSTNGLVTLTLDPDAEPTATAASATAVSALLPNGGHSLTPVVSSLTVDGAGSLVHTGSGAYRLSVGYADGHALRPAIVSLDGATVTTLNAQLTYIFPAGRTSSITGSIHVNAPPAGAKWLLHPFVEVAGVAGTFIITALWSPLPTIFVDGESATAVAVATTPALDDVTLAVTTTDGNRLAKSTVETADATTAGTLTVTIACTPSATAWHVLNFGATVGIGEV